MTDMKMRASFFLCLITPWVAFGIQNSSSWRERNIELTVKSKTGSYTGLRDSEYGGVRVFRNIPYAKAPVGKLRWKPPVPRQLSSQHHYSYRFPPPCPQYLSTSLSLWNSNISGVSVVRLSNSYYTLESLLLDLSVRPRIAKPVLQWARQI